jgi:enamine deaminase RidA (YjgF/YER057c/UK114 family)
LRAIAACRRLQSAALERGLRGTIARVTGRQNIGSGTPWEDVAGYSRAVRVGDQVFVSGTTAHDDSGNLQGGQDAFTQATYILRKIATALERAGASLEDVVRTRVYVVRLEDWREVARAHGDAFGHIRPANTLVQVAGLVDGPLVEIEVDAIIQR